MIDGWLNLTSVESPWPCGNVSMSDVWQLEEEALSLVASLEAQLCHSEDLEEELLNWPPIGEIVEIVRINKNILNDRFKEMY